MTNETDEYLPDQQEDASDLKLPPDWYSGATLWSTDWTTETIVSQLKRGNINLNPRFQRRNAWTSDRASLLIESLILGLPVPQIILAEEKGKKGSFIVIDGKQRLIALRKFAADGASEEFSQLRLSGLTDRRELNGLSYSALQSRPDLQEDLNSFDNQTIRTVVIRGWTDEQYLYSVFLRINSNSVQLSPQELRQALHQGPFSNYIDDFSTTCAPLKKALKLDAPDFRMRDVELILRYFAYRNFAYKYPGDLKKFLDQTIDEINKSWEILKEEIFEQSRQFELALNAIHEIFGSGELRKWNGDRYEKPINRAVFDIMVYYLSDDETRAKALNLPGEVKASFEKLCVENRDFISSLELTTKSLPANAKRFKTWATTLSQVLDMEVRAPINTLF